MYNVGLRAYWNYAVKQLVTMTPAGLKVVNTMGSKVLYMHGTFCSRTRLIITTAHLLTHVYQSDTTSTAHIYGHFTALSHYFKDGCHIMGITKTARLRQRLKKTCCILRPYLPSAVLVRSRDYCDREPHGIVSVRFLYTTVYNGVHEILNKNLNWLNLNS